jgi:TRAP-type C4-dicarboxylate transport system permease small subunit
LDANQHPQRDPVLLRLIDGVTQGMNIIGSCLIIALMCLVGLDVLGRNLMGSPVSGVPEIVTLSIVAIVFLQIPQALRQGRITSSEAVRMLLARHAPGIGRLLDDLVDLCGVCVTGIIVWTTWFLLVKSWNNNDFIGAIGEFTAPTWPVKLIIVSGGFTLILQFLLRIYRRHRGAL